MPRRDRVSAHPPFRGHPRAAPNHARRSRHGRFRPPRFLRRRQRESDGGAGGSQFLRTNDALGHATWPAAALSALLGMTVAVVIAALTVRLQQAFAPDRCPWPIAFSPSLGVGISLLTLAIGVRVPQGVAMWICSIAWRRFVRAGRPSNISGVVISPGSPDRPLYWVTFAVIALAAGIGTALLPTLARLTSVFYAWLQTHFVWSTIPLVGLTALLVFLTGLIPLAILGLAVSCAHHLCCRFGHWDTLATAWLLVGAAPGTVLALFLCDSLAAADAMLVAAALPALIVAIIAAMLGSSGGERKQADFDRDAASLPLCRDRWPSLLRASIVAVGGGSACGVMVWAELSGHEAGGGPALMGAMLLALGIGVLLGCSARLTTIRSIGGFGGACAAAGVLVALGTLAVPQDGAPLSVSANILACVGVAAIGFATSYGRQTLLARVASRSSAGAKILARLLACGAFTILIGAPVAIHVFGRPAALMMLALSMVALGGTLIIHEPGYSPQRRRARLVGVFASVAMLIVLTVLPGWVPPIHSSGDIAERARVSSESDRHDALWGNAGGENVRQ